jgi:hypothetical protein
MPSLNEVDFNCKYGEVLNSFEDIISWLHELSLTFMNLDP